MNLYKFTFANDITCDRSILIEAESFNVAMQVAKSRQKIDEYILEVEEIMEEKR